MTKRSDDWWEPFQPTDAEREELARDRRVGNFRRMVKLGFPALAMRNAIGELPGDRDATGHRVLGAPPVDVKPADRIDTDAMKAARRFVEGDRTILVLLGGTGTGKTTAAAWAAYALNGRAPTFLRAVDLERAGRYDTELQKKVSAADVLVLDDLGVEFFDQKGNFASLVDAVVDEFYADRRRLIVTSNLSATDLLARYGQRVTSRLSEVGVIEACGSKDLRRKAKP